MNNENMSKLAALTTLYQVERQENAVAVQVMAAIVGATLAFVVVVLGALETSNAQISAWLVAAAPLVPILLVAWFSLFLSEAVVRRDYIKALEKELARILPNNQSANGWILSKYVITTEALWAPRWRRSGRLARAHAVVVVVTNVGLSISLGLFLGRILFLVRDEGPVFLLSAFVYIPLFLIIMYLLVSSALGRHVLEIEPIEEELS